MITTTPTATPVQTAPAPHREAPAHLSDPILAKALLSVWSGDPALVIDSPPGAGKTRLITHLAQQLTERAAMRVAIAAQTRAQAYDVANRTAATGVPTVFVGKNKTNRPAELDPSIEYTPRARLHLSEGVVVATTASWQWTDTTAFHADALLVDESYQMTFATLGTLGPLADRYALVGDPGQIAPVVTGNTRRWAHMPAGPHLPAPQALRALYPDDVTTLRLPRTWRLGPHTTDLIRPLYPTLNFTSARPPRQLSDATGTLPEFRALPIPVINGPSDTTIATSAAAAARHLLAATLHTDETHRPLVPGDIAVIAPHVDQATMIAAALADLPEIFVGTTNQAQGLEREAVVAVHPFAGYSEAEGFAGDLGRLCVALSRHRTHLTVITDTHTPTVLARGLRETPDSHDLRTHQTILDRLLTSP